MPAEPRMCDRCGTTAALAIAGQEHLCSDCTTALLRIDLERIRRRRGVPPK